MRKDVFLCRCSEVDRVLNTLNTFWPFTETSAMQTQNQQTAATVGKRTNAPQFPSQGYIRPDPEKYLCAQYLLIQCAACSPEAQCFPAAASRFQSEMGANLLFAQLHTESWNFLVFQGKVSNKYTEMGNKQFAAWGLLISWCRSHHSGAQLTAKHGQVHGHQGCSTSERFPYSAQNQ